MHFIIGTISVVAAIVLLGFAKYVTMRWESSSWIQRFAGTETMALLITTLLAFGVAFLCAGLASSQTALGYTELAGCLGLILLALLAVIRLFRRSVAAPAAMTTRAPV